MNRIVVGAHYGLKDWLAQRITAVVMALYTVYIGGALVCWDGSYESWHALLSGSLTRFFTFLFIQVSIVNLIKNEAHRYILPYKKAPDSCVSVLPVGRPRRRLIGA